MDTVRADRVGGFGSPSATPNLAAIAAEGSRFTRFYAASNFTLTSHMSIFTGLDPLAHGVRSDPARLAPSVPTLAELLSEAGYRTRAFHEGGYLAPRFGFDRGFDLYRGLPTLALVQEALPVVLRSLRDAGRAPYFLFLHTYAAHNPYGGYARYAREHPERGLPAPAAMRELRRRYPPNADGRRAARELPQATHEHCTLYNVLVERHGQRLGCGRNRPPEELPASPHFAADRAAMLASYDARIARIDRALGAIRGVLVELGQWDDTLLVVTSDHGEAFFEHELYGHGYGPFEEVLRIPLVISYPALLREGGVRVVDGLAWHLDLLPTILSLAGGAAPPGLPGLDLSDAMRGRAELPAGRAVAPVVVSMPQLGPRRERRVLLQERHKYVSGDEAFGDAAGLLFDLERDSGERHNLRAAEQGRFADLSQRARDWEQGLTRSVPVDQRSGEPLPRDGGQPPAALSLEQEAELRALGYVE